MTYRIHPLMVGEAHVAKSLDVFWSLTRDVGPVRVPILAFLIEGGPEPILVDTGMRDPQRAMDVHGLGPHRRAENWTLEAQLLRHGLELDDIPTVILTHLHYDHAGGCDQLSSARFIMQRTELMAAAAPMGPGDLDIGGKDLFFDRKDVSGLVDDLWDRVDLIEGDEEVAPGVHCVAYPNSHTPGSQCIYVETEDGIVSIVGDMVRKVELNVDRLVPPGLFYDLESMRRAIGDIRDRSDIVYPAHDPALAPEPMNEEI